MGKDCGSSTTTSLFGYETSHPWALRKQDIKLPCRTPAGTNTCTEKRMGKDRAEKETLEVVKPKEFGTTEQGQTHTRGHCRIIYHTPLCVHVSPSENASTHFGLNERGPTTMTNRRTLQKSNPALKPGESRATFCTKGPTLRRIGRRRKILFVGLSTIEDSELCHQNVFKPVRRPDVGD